MAEIVVEIPDSLKEKLKKIQLSKVIARVVKQIEEENEMTEWSLKLQHASRKGRFEELKKKGLI